MLNDFLAEFLRLSMNISGAQRGMALDSNLETVVSEGIDPDEHDRLLIEVTEHARKAVATNKSVITNNMITDPTQAPKTNTSFADLRVVVVIPLSGYGAIYFDQGIRSGVVSSTVVDKLMLTGQHIIQEGLENQTASAFEKIYEKMVTS